MADGAQQCTADWLRSTKEGLKPDFNALDIWGAQTMMNWPTAFVIAVAICAGAFLYNKPSDAAFGGSDRYWVRIASPDDEMRIQTYGEQQRWCMRSQDDRTGIKCGP